MVKPNMLSGKRILLCVTGSIAAYKAVELLRRLTESGAEVRVVMTKHAAQFITRMTFEALSRYPVLLDEFEGQGQTVMGHIAVTQDLDLAIVAPATANIIGKMAAGIADDAVTTALMAAECPVIVAPAMNDRMYRNTLLQKNIAVLKEHGVYFIEPEAGSLACGAEGKGRLAGMEAILNEVSRCLSTGDLSGRTVLVTAGPTREHIDAVRFISNPSTGKMGYALAAAARDRGAAVVLVAGPNELEPPFGVTMVPVVSASDMHKAVMEYCGQSSIIIMAAAVSDFRPAQTSAKKIKKDEAGKTLDLEMTDDILSALGRAGGDRILVGFAAETDDLEKNARKKLKDKNLDMIVANDLSRNGSGFGSDTNAVIIMDRNGNRTELETMSKREIARHILNEIVKYSQQKGPAKC